MAEGLVSLGLPRQSRIGIFAPNTKEWLLTQLAASLADLILVNINPSYQEWDLEYALNKVEVSVLVMTPEYKNTNYVNLLNKLVPEISGSPKSWSSQRVPSLSKIILASGPSQPGMITFDDLYGMNTPEYAQRTAGVKFEEPTNIQFTSGTTGNPKAATLTHHNIINNAYYIGQTLNYSSADRVCIPVPLYHCFGMVLGNLACITHGSTMVYPSPHFSAESTMDSVEAEECTSLYGVPTMFLEYLNEQNRRARNVHSLRTGIVAGSICTADLMKRIVDTLNISEMTNCYGMTETSPVSFQLPRTADFEKRISTVGMVHPHVEAKVIDEYGNILEMGEVGELCSKGYLVMKGYWGDQEETSKAVDQDAWMHTGDLAVFTEDGYARIVGRIKDIIIRAGENIYPHEVENLMQQHPDIEDVHVIGVPDEKYGEEVCAWIKMKQGKTPLTVTDVKKFSEGKFAYYKVPKLIKIVDSFPITVTGKVKKYLMRSEYKETNKVYYGN